MSSTLKIEKLLDALPSQLVPNTMYLVKTGDTVATYITDKDGTKAYAAGGGSSAAAADEIDEFLLMGGSSD